jgi:tRNA(Ile)-lysidine synthetase-like protein
VLRSLRAPLGVWGVTGNHEYYAGLERCLAVYESAGIRTLRDGWVEAAPGLVLAGVDDLTARRQLGLDGHTSIKRLFSSRRVPRHLRDDHPLVLCDGEVLWVPGCARSDRGLIGPATSRCYVIRLIRRPNESA